MVAHILEFNELAQVAGARRIIHDLRDAQVRLQVVNGGGAICRRGEKRLAATVYRADAVKQRWPQGRKGVGVCRSVGGHIGERLPDGLVG